MLLKASISSVDDQQLSSVEPESSDNASTLTTLPVRSAASLAGSLHKLVPKPRRFYKRRRPSQLVPRTIASSSTGSSRAAMLSMIEREGPGETALHKATRLAYKVMLMTDETFLTRVLLRVCRTLFQR